jgi:hypothetical protein
LYHHCEEKHRADSYGTIGKDAGWAARDRPTLLNLRTSRNLHQKTRRPADHTINNARNVSGAFVVDVWRDISPSSSLNFNQNRLSVRPSSCQASVNMPARDEDADADILGLSDSDFDNDDYDATYEERRRRKLKGKGKEVVNKRGASDKGKGKSKEVRSDFSASSLNSLTFMRLATICMGRRVCAILGCSAGRRRWKLAKRG